MLSIDRDVHSWSSTRRTRGVSGGWPGIRFSWGGEWVPPQELCAPPESREVARVAPEVACRALRLFITDSTVERKALGALSVIIPARNAGAFIDVVLAAVLSQ